MAENEQYTTIYKPITWKAGDRITGEKLNNLENEVALLSAQVKNAIKESTDVTGEDQQQYILSQKINNLFSFLQGTSIEEVNDDPSLIPTAANFIVYGQQQDTIEIPTWNELVTIVKNFASIYDPNNSTNYKKYDLVLKEQANTDKQDIKDIKLYQCLQNTTYDSAWDANHWEEISLGTVVSALSRLVATVIPENLVPNDPKKLIKCYIHVIQGIIKTTTSSKIVILTIPVQSNKWYKVYCPYSPKMRVGAGISGLTADNGNNTFTSIAYHHDDNSTTESAAQQKPLFIYTDENDTCLYIQLFGTDATDQVLAHYLDVLTITEDRNNQHEQSTGQNKQTPQQGQEQEIILNVSNDFISGDALLLQKQIPEYFIYGKVEDSIHYYSPEIQTSETETLASENLGEEQNASIDYDSLLLNENQFANSEIGHYLEKKIASIPQGKHFFYITDTHWPGNVRHSPILLNYLRNRLGISDCLFGGDFLNFSYSPKHAQFVMYQFAKAMQNVFGDHFYSAIGNHDQNLAHIGSSDDDTQNGINNETAASRFLSFKQNYDCLFKPLAHKAHTFWDAEYVVYNENTHSFVASMQAKTNGERIEKLWREYQRQKAATNAGVPVEEIAIEQVLIQDSDLEELASYGKMTYYIDDDSQKIRYINAICTSKPTNECKWVELFSHDTINALIGWLYQVILSTPKNYDIIYNTHVGPKPIESQSTIQVAIRHVPTVSVMLMAAKLKSTNKRIPIESSACQLSTYDREFMWPDRTYVYDSTTAAKGDLQLDFSNANDIGQVMIFSGHYHADKIMISHQSIKGVVRQVYWSEYNNWAEYNNNNDTLDQTVKQSTGQGCPIPVIYTTADVETQANQAYAESRTGWYDRYGAQSRPLMKKGTLTEQAFDIVTLTSEGVHFTRIGAGPDRDIKIKYTTTTEQQ